MDFMLWSLNLAWKVLVIVMGWMLFRYVLKNGSGTFKEILDTIGIGLRTMGHAIRKWCLEYLRKESAEAESKPDDNLIQRYNSYCKEQQEKVLTFEEFCKVMESNEKFTL